ncbi:MAG: hypothetical protein J6C60_00135 [Alistipes sp.]|nr:hypothetical protein [Alistipes sp.]MBO5398720.1 hypothetical protein [Alistipes sp.]MBP3473710.1 hypothetical protein [Alistipes sp.]
MKLSNELFFAQVESLLSTGEEVEILVKGHSMTPLMLSGKDVAILRSATDADIKVGAVVLFRYRGAHVLHRIEKIEGDRITFAGDGNYKIKEVATRQDIVAVMVAVKRSSGRRVECSGKSWRWQSRAWLMLPEFARRVILGIRRRLIA